MVAESPASRQIAVYRVMSAGLVGQQIGANATAVQFRQHFGGIAEQADGDRLLFGAAFFNNLHCFFDRARCFIKIAGAQAHLYTGALHRTGTDIR